MPPSFLKLQGNCSHTALLYKENEGQKNIPTENKSKQDAHTDKHYSNELKDIKKMLEAMKEEHK